MSKADQLCERCGKPPRDPTKRIEEHHPLPRRHYGAGASNPLVAHLCPDCHKLADRIADDITREMVQENREYFLTAFNRFMRPNLRIVR